MSLIPTRNQALITDLYQLTMAAGYFSHGMSQTSTFELYVRRLPQQRNFLVAAGLEQALDYLENLHFEADEIEYLRTLPMFAAVDSAFWEYLTHFRFSGEVWALPEGTVFFPYEPLIRVTAPVIEAQIVETWLLSLLNYQTSVASKAARVWLACQQAQHPVSFVDFGSRRAHGPEASVLAARAAFIGGAEATANVYAGFKTGIPVRGTAAHSWTMAFPDEPSAFRAYHEIFPGFTTLLIDTYDTLQGAHHATSLGPQIQGVRLDSGDFLSLSREVRAILDAAGLTQTRIVVSGDMNEHKIADLLQAGAPVDIFGVGTELATSIDAPSLGGVYKLAEQTEHGQTRYAIKLSRGKIGYPGAKQVWRTQNNGRLSSDCLALAGESVNNAEPLLKAVMRKGQRCEPNPALTAIRAHTLAQIGALPEVLQQLPISESPHPVSHSPGLQALFARLSAEHHVIPTEEASHV